MLNHALLALPFEPDSPETVLEKLPRAAFSRVKQIRPQPQETNITTIVARAQEYISASRSEADPRYLGYAQALLKPWWSLSTAPVPVLVLRATIKQSLHDFGGALEDLDLLLSIDPQNAQGWLTRATVLQVQGRLTEAKKACLPLFQTAPRHIAVACLASVASLNGEAMKSYQLLDSALHLPESIPTGEKLWMLTILGEIAVGLGEREKAETHFQQALALNPADVYLLAAYSDFLLEGQRYEQTNTLLKEHERIDALLLRRAIARQAIKAANADQDRKELASRFKTSRTRGDATHSREEARFTLALTTDTARALELARSNWQTQKEPADALIFLEAALAASNPTAAAPVLEWMKETGIEHHHLRMLARQIHE